MSGGESAEKANKSSYLTTESQTVPGVLISPEKLTFCHRFESRWSGIGRKESLARGPHGLYCRELNLVVLRKEG